MLGTDIRLPIPTSFEDMKYLVQQLQLTIARVYEDYGSFVDVNFTWNPGSLADGVGETSGDIAVETAALGDFVLLGAPYDLQGVTCTGYVQATNVVRIRLQNESGGVVDLASGVWKVRIIKYK